LDFLKSVELELHIWLYVLLPELANNVTGKQYGPPVKTASNLTNLDKHANY